MNSKKKKTNFKINCWKIENYGKNKISKLLV